MPKRYLVVKDKKLTPKDVDGVYEKALDAEVQMVQKNRYELFGDRWTVIMVEEKSAKPQPEDSKLTKTSCL